MGTKKAKATKERIPAKGKASVSFHSVQVRMYPITLGHNPGGIDGPPLSLSWDYINLGEAPIDDFETHRSAKQYKRRSAQDMYLTSKRRIRLLRQAGFTDSQIRKAAKEAYEEREYRRLSLEAALSRARARKAARRVPEGVGTKDITESQRRVTRPCVAH